MKKHLLTKTFLFFAFLIWANVGWAQETIIYSTGFEDAEGFTKNTVYNNTTVAFTGPALAQWGTYYGTPSTTGPITDLQSMQMRYYTTAAANYGYTYTDFDLANVTKVTFNAKNNGVDATVTASYSTDGGTSYIGGQEFTLSGTADNFEYIISATGAFPNVRMKFSLTGTTVAERLTIDDVVVYGITVDTEAPEATWDPADTETAVAIDKAITITFDEAIRDITTDADFNNTTVDALITTFETVVGSTPVTYDATIDVTNQIITITPDADLAFNTEYTITIAAVEDALDNATSGETITFTTVPDTDKDSKVIAPGTQVAAATIESTQIDSFPVFAFTISDMGTADGLDTKVTQITLKAGPNNTFDFENEDGIAGGYLISEGGINIPFAAEPVSASSTIQIQFALDALTIPDGEDSTYTVYLLLDTEIADAKVIQFMIDANAHGFIANNSGSEFAADFGADVTGNNITINVTATELQFSAQPTGAYVGAYLNEVKVAATDLNGNIDTDYVTDITITATDATLTGTPVSATPVAGLATFDALSFSDAATGVTLTAASGTFTDVESNAFNVTVEPETDLFFSEYIEGGGYNKALEIYNGTGADVNLSSYIIRGNHNGSAWEEVFELPDFILSNDDVYVIVHEDADAGIVAVADSIVINPYDGGTSNIANFNGDDVRGLFKVIGEDTTLIDIIGRYDLVDPGSSWPVAGDYSTSDNTLLRKRGTTHGNTNWDWSAGTNENNSEWKVYEKDFYANLGAPTPEASNEAKMLSFTFGNEYDYEEATITTATGTIDITVINGTDASALTPTFTISDFATVDSISGVEHDFSVPFVYTITAEDGITVKEWTVNVTVSATLSAYAEILEMEVEDADSVMINPTDATITIYAPYGFDVTSVKPVFETSAGSAIADTATARDFTTAQTYVVTAQDASTKDWEITLNVFAPEEVTIYDIQYTADESGNSPYKGKVVITSGIVTAIGSGSLYVQDGTGAWNGVYVYSSTTADAVTVGDEIEFASEVDEYYELTELKNVAGLEIISSDNDLPAVTTVTALEAQNEDYEGVFIFVTDAECTSIDATNGMMEVNDGTSALLVDDDILKPLTLELGKVYDITGIGHYSFSDRKIIPRSAADITVSTTGINDIVFSSIKLYPNPSNGLVKLELNNVNNEELFVEVYNVIGTLVYKAQITENVTDLNLTGMNAGIYYVSVRNNDSKNVSKIMIQ